MNPVGPALRNMLKFAVPLMSHVILSRAKAVRCSGIISPADGTTLELEKKGGKDKLFVFKRL